MKLVLQEHLVAEEFFFSVDTHDEVTLRPDAPDREQWESLRAFNRALKGRIEEAWDQAGLPTHHDLLALLDDLARREREGAKRKTLLLVDDEVMVCRGLAALLRARGYEVELVHDGRAALERLDGDPLPDLVLLDYDMPNLDGRQVVDHLRSNDRTRRLPVLMATASAVDLGQLQTVSGVLHKPYPRQVLFELISRLLADTRAAPEVGRRRARLQDGPIRGILGRLNPIDVCRRARDRSPGPPTPSLLSSRPFTLGPEAGSMHGSIGASRRRANRPDEAGDPARGLRAGLRDRCAPLPSTPSAGPRPSSWTGNHSRTSSPPRARDSARACCGSSARRTSAL
jgi:CheY-like chemotaxis protein